MAGPESARDRVIAAMSDCAARLKPVAVDLPEEQGTAYVRVITARERDAFEQSMLDEDRNVSGLDIRAKLCVRAWCDPDGKRIFADDDVELVSGFPATIIDRIYDAAQKLNQLRREDVEDLRKNSRAARSGGSSSSSV
jgi:hypothetical protein